MTGVVFVGGLKTWECSYDLVDYLKTIRENYSNQTTVLEVNETRENEKSSANEMMNRLDVGVLDPEWN